MPTLSPHPNINFPQFIFHASEFHLFKAEYVSSAVSHPYPPLMNISSVAATGSPNLRGTGFILFILPSCWNQVQNILREFVQVVLPRATAAAAVYVNSKMQPPALGSGPGPRRPLAYASHPPPGDANHKPKPTGRSPNGSLLWHKSILTSSHGKHKTNSQRDLGKGICLYQSQDS